MQWSARAGALAYRAGWAGVARMPVRPAYALFSQLADRVYARDGRSVQRLRANYARVRPELGPDGLEDLVRAGVRSYFRYWCDAFRLQTVSREDLLAVVSTTGMDPLRESIDSGQGAVAFLGHLGNWDLAGAWSTHALGPVTTVAERLRPEELYDAFVAYREGLGMTIIARSGGAPVFPQLVSRVRQGGAWIPLLADRDPSADGVEVSLAGHPARAAVGPAALAVATGVPLFPLATRYDLSVSAPGIPHGVVIDVGPRIPVPEVGTTREKVAVMTQAAMDGLSATIVGHTEDWHMMQRVFSADWG